MRDCPSKQLARHPLFFPLPPARPAFPGLPVPSFFRGARISFHFSQAPLLRSPRDPAAGAAFSSSGGGASRARSPPAPLVLSFSPLHSAQISPPPPAPLAPVHGSPLSTFAGIDDLEDGAPGNLSLRTGPHTAGPGARGCPRVGAERGAGGGKEADDEAAWKEIAKSTLSTKPVARGKKCPNRSWPFVYPEGSRSGGSGVRVKPTAPTLFCSPQGVAVRTFFLQADKCHGYHRCAHHF